MLGFLTVLQSLLQFGFRACVMHPSQSGYHLSQEAIAAEQEAAFACKTFLRERNKREMLEHPQKSFQSMTVVKKDSCSGKRR